MMRINGLIIIMLRVTGGMNPKSPPGVFLNLICIFVNC